jgi:uncharacterized protein YndB with AHSA1/START domain
MTETSREPGAAPPLIVRRVIDAPAERLFAFWTEPRHLRAWWGPAGVTCSSADVDLRVGGRYRIANEFPDGRVLWIAGEFERVDPPRELVYSWRIEPELDVHERVTVQFEPRGRATEVTITHERIPDARTREGHEQGWVGCLDGLVEYVASA